MCMQIFIIALFLKDHIGNNPNSHQMVDRETIGGIFVE